MTYKTRFYLLTAIVLWASAFVGIRVGLHDYSPEGLALLRYLIASVCIGVIYFHLREGFCKISLVDQIGLLGIGAIGIGIYNLTLNHGELIISSGMSSFMVSQSPIITTILAVLVLGEQFNRLRLLGFAVSALGVVCITIGELGGLNWDISMTYLLAAAVAGSCYTISQKSFLKKYHPIQVTTYSIWGGALFLLWYAPEMQRDVLHAAYSSTLTVVYLGAFPAAVGYIAWSYVLNEIPASRAASFLYVMPFLASLLGMLFLHEVPVLMAIAGGCLSILGVWFVNQSYQVASKAV